MDRQTRLPALSVTWAEPACNLPMRRVTRSVKCVRSGKRGRSRIGDGANDDTALLMAALCWADAGGGRAVACAKAVARRRSGHRAAKLAETLAKARRDNWHP